MKNGLVKFVLVALLVVVASGAVSSMTKAFLNGCKDGKVNGSEIVNAGVESISDDLAVGETINIDKEDASNTLERAWNGLTNLFGGCEERSSNLIDMNKILMVDAQ